MDKRLGPGGPLTLWLLVFSLILPSHSHAKAWPCLFRELNAEDAELTSAIRQAGEKLKMPEAVLDRLLKRIPRGRLAEASELFRKIADNGGGLTKDDFLKLNRLLKEFKAQSLFVYHTTREGTIDKIVQARVDGEGVGAMKPGKYEWAIYALDSPANLSPAGALRAWSAASAGKETVIFQGDAAALFQAHPRNGIAPALKNLNGEKVVRDAQLVIDEFQRLDDDTLVITKAHLAPMTAEQARQAKIGKLVFAIPDGALLTSVGVLLAKGMLSVYFQSPDDDSKKKK